jgi:integrase
MIKVTLRKRPITDNRQTLYLDFYPAIQNPVNGEQTRREYLGLYIFNKPRNPFDISHNKETLKMAEMKRLQRYNELNKPEVYNTFELDQLKKKEIGDSSFSDYFKKLVLKWQHTNHDTMVSMSKHLNVFAGDELKFSDITEKFCNGFKDYLITAVNISNKIPISQNTASLYFSKFKAVLRQAYKEGYLPTYLNDKLGSIKTNETRRNYLSMDELNKLVKAPCTNPILKRAALFSALTGLRFSDIEKLTWHEVEVIDGNYLLNFTQRKTGFVEALPISQQAANFLGIQSEYKPFEGLRYDTYQNRLLLRWITAAGITKKITFHCFRHTFATLQLSNGTDIYTVSKLLGHRDLKTTQVYAHVLSQAKREAVNRIKLDI